MRRGIETPILLRFDGILRARVRDLNQALQRRRAREFNYEAPYRGVFPIKVNQQRHVVEALLEEGRQARHGPGGRQQARAAGGDRAATPARRSLMICNGYKDEDYIETALLAEQARASRRSW